MRLSIRLLSGLLRVSRLWRLLTISGLLGMPWLLGRLLTVPRLLRWLLPILRLLRLRRLLRLLRWLLLPVLRLLRLLRLLRWGCLRWLAMRGWRLIGISRL